MSRSRASGRDLLELLETAQALNDWRARAGGELALVPTMGNLHAGHLSLVRAAQQRCDVVIVSIFVNPLQFGPGEDLNSYPRTFDADRSQLAACRVDAIFAPDVATMYPRGGDSDTRVRVAGITDILCGRQRPGHFEGVATVVTKLFNLVRPEHAFFGEKDYQQLAVIRRMTADLGMGVAIHGVATERERDGLALSSRNQYLNADERARAPALAQALDECVERLAAGERDFAALQARGTKHLAEAGFEPEYFEVRDAELAAPSANTRCFRVFAAGVLGGARLIDNKAFEADE